MMMTPPKGKKAPPAAKVQLRELAPPDDAFIDDDYEPDDESDSSSFSHGHGSLADDPPDRTETGEDY